MHLALSLLLSSAALSLDCPGPTLFAPGQRSLPDRSGYRTAFTRDGRTGP